MADNRDHECPESSVHPTLLAKWSQAFEFLDYNRDGIYTMASHDTMVGRLMDRASLTGEKREFCSTLGKDYWFYIHRMEANTDIELTREKFVYYAKLMFVEGHLRDAIYVLAQKLFYCMDLDGDGWISYEEFALVSEAAARSGVRYIQIAFDAIDTDHDGSLSLDEYVAALVKYWIDPTVELKHLPMYGVPPDFVIDSAASC